MSPRSLALVVVLMILIVTPSLVLCSECPKLNDKCGPETPCCECDPSNGNKKLYCEYLTEKGFICNTYPFDTKCKCDSDGTCRKSLQDLVSEALGLPRKLNMG